MDSDIVKVVYDGTPGDFDLIKNKIYYVLGTTSDSYYIYDETKDVYLYPKSIFKNI